MRVHWLIEGIFYIAVSPIFVALLPFICTLEHLKISKKDDMPDKVQKVVIAVVAQLFVMALLVGGI